jgi:hypothetical protein
MNVDNQNYNSHQVSFIPTVEDWAIFLDKWNQQVFEKLKARNIQPSKYHHYSEDTDYNCYHLPGATEAQIIELEQRLQTKLPVGYKNFLIASNGFVRDFASRNPGAFRYRSFWDMMQTLFLKSCESYLF